MTPRDQTGGRYSAVCMSYVYMALWITLSSAVILYNKYVLAISGFPYPIALTMIHMGFCSVMAWLLMTFGHVIGLRIDPVDMSSQTYLRCVLPVGALFSVVLWLGNTVYIYLSVSFIQMLKASMPVAVFIVGVVMRTERYSLLTAVNMVVIGGGIALASYGEINFVWFGVAMQVISIVCESVRLTLIQVLMQRQGIKLNPITTMYYISPCCFLFLCIPFTFIEAPQLYGNADLVVDVPMLLSNAACAFALNISVFMLIGATSALTMNVAGVIKDWLLIVLSVLLFHSPVSATSLVGYLIAFAGVKWYNNRRVKEMASVPATPKSEDSSETPLKGSTSVGKGNA